MTLHAACNWLANSTVGQLMQAHQWLVPAVQTLHILCLAVLFPAAVFMCLRWMGLGSRGEPAVSVAARVLPWAGLGLLGLLVSGGLLILAEPERELPNPAFQLKMLMLVAVLGLTAVMVRGPQRNTAYVENQSSLSTSMPWAMRLGGAVAILLWLGIVVAGRWIAYAIET